ncbi:fructose-1-phosphate kinase PfkB-like protein [Streptomyces sp. SPB162]|nr:fructose-1-phosphate kinase PfkB-like protein [Streptomyces sp. SPB162]
MIITVTPNAALDLTYRVPRLLPHTTIGSPNPWNGPAARA